MSPNFAQNPAPKQAAADVSGSPYGDQIFVIQHVDGTVIGALVTLGLQITDPVPAMSGLAGWGNMVMAGSGSYLGITGQVCGNGGGGTPAGGARRTSVAEDPANRRTNGGGNTHSVFCLIPRTRPAVRVTANGPAVAHASDFSLVTPARPAKPGELLSLFASGLGPTRPGVDPGQPFGDSPLQIVNAPVDVLINGQPAEVLYAGGYPGTTDSYQVNFRISANTSPGIATVQLIAAWIPGPEARIVVQQ